MNEARMSTVVNLVQRSFGSGMSWQSEKKIAIVMAIREEKEIKGIQNLEKK